MRPEPFSDDAPSDSRGGSSSSEQPQELPRRVWWERPGLTVWGGRLQIAGRDAEALAREHGTPLYVHDCVHVEEQVRALQDAMGRAGLRHRVRLALKAQRLPAVLRHLRRLGRPGTAESVGMDVCSPGELKWALEHGWEPHEISYTGTNLSHRDLDRILRVPDTRLNVDLITQIERVGRRAPGRRIGLRINPRDGAGFEGDGQTLYSGPRPTKFGIFPEQLDEALEVAGRHDLVIDTVHCHVGDGYLSDGLDTFDRVVGRLAEVTAYLREHGCPIGEVNTGGGLGVPQRAEDEPLDLDRWAAILERHLGSLDVVVATEPGDFLVKDAVTHLAEVVTVEARDGVLFVGVDTGWNVMAEHFIYGSLLDVVVCKAADAEPVGRVTISGNINEGDDLFVDDYAFPEVEEGDIVAALHVGSYNASIWSEHCLRPPAESIVFHDRL